MRQRKGFGTASRADSGHGLVDRDGVAALSAGDAVRDEVPDLIVLGVAAYLISQRTGDSLTASTAITVALGGVTLALAGGAIFLRYSLTGFLRFWMARQSFELNLLAERAFAGPT
jgi:hypothetical protein